MSNERLMLLGAISQMPKEAQDAINAYADKFRDMLKEGGENAQVAFGLVGIEETEASS